MIKRRAKSSYLSPPAGPETRTPIKVRFYELWRYYTYNGKRFTSECSLRDEIGRVTGTKGADHPLDIEMVPIPVAKKPVPRKKKEIK